MMKHFFIRVLHFFTCRVALLNEKIEYKLNEYNYASQAKNLAALDVTSQNESVFFKQVRIITHAGGGMAGLPYLNCQEGFEHYYALGNRVFEFDVTESTDKCYVLSHQDVAVSEADFVNTKIDGRFTPLKIDNLLDTLSSNNDFKVIFDCKMPHLQAFAEYVVTNVKNKEALDKIVIQVFNEENILEVQSVYPFKVLFVCMMETDYVNAINLCVKYNIGAVSVSYKAIQERVGWDLFRKANICSFAYSVNTVREYKKLLGQGITGVFSDFLLESDVCEDKE